MNQSQSDLIKLCNPYFYTSSRQLYELQKQLDAIVLQAYGFSPDDDLLELNLELADKEKRGEPVIGPWAPNQ